MDRTRWILWSGRSGMFGAALLVVGDMLIGGWRPFGGPDLVGLDFEGFIRLAYAGERTALLVGALLGPISAIFYLFGLTQLWLALRSAGPTIAGLACGALTIGLMVGGGGVHIAYAFLPTGLLAEQAGATSSEVWDHVTFMLNGITLTSGIPLVLGSLAFGWAVAFRDTAYPRWMALLSPILLIATKPIAGFVPAPIGGPLFVAHFNLCFWLFFAVSTRVLLRKENDEAGAAADTSG